MMSEEEKVIHSNKAWLGVICHRPRSCDFINTIALDRLVELRYIDVIGNMAFPTELGRTYHTYIRQIEESG